MDIPRPQFNPKDVENSPSGEQESAPNIDPERWGLAAMSIVNAGMGGWMVPTLPFGLLWLQVGVALLSLLLRKNKVRSSWPGWLVSIAVFLLVYSLFGHTHESMVPHSVVALWALVQALLCGALYLPRFLFAWVYLSGSILLVAFLGLGTVLVLGGESVGALILIRALARLLFAGSLLLWTWTWIGNATVFWTPHFFAALPGQGCPVSAGKAWDDRLGIALVLVALCLPMGEGLTFAGGAVLVVVWLCHRRQGGPLVGRVSRLVPLGCLFLCWMVLGTAQGVWTSGADFQWRRLGDFLPFLLFAPCAWGAQRAKGVWIGRAVAAFFAALTLSTLFGWSVFSISSVGHGADSLLHQLLANTTPQGRLGDAFRPAGFFMNRLRMSHFLLVGMVGLLALVAVQIANGLWRRHLRTNLAAVALLGLFGGTLVALETRAALLVALAIGSLTLFGLVLNRLTGFGPWLRPWLGFVVLISLAGAGLWGIGIGAMEESGWVEPGLEAKVRVGLNGRDHIWAVSTSMLEEHPWGFGHGQYRYVSRPWFEAQRQAGTELVFFRDHHQVLHAHHSWLTTWLESGPLGFLVYLMMWVYVLARAFFSLLRPGAQPPKWSQQWAACTLIGLCVAAALLGMFHDPFYHKVVAFGFLGSAGFCLGILSRPIEEVRT